MMILTKCGERSRLAGKLPQSNQPCLSAVTVWALCLWRHLAISPSLFSFSLSLCLAGRGHVCQGGLAAGGGRLPCFEVSALTGGWARAGDLKALSVTAWVTFQHRPAWPSRVCVCVCVLYICLRVCVCVCGQWVSLLMASAVLKDCQLLGAICLRTKGITFHYIKKNKK